MLGLTFLVSLVVLELGLFVFGPLLQNSVGPVGANVFYVLLRVFTILVFSYLCVRRHKRSNYEALSLTGLLIFIDQVGFKSLWLWMEMKRNPAAWEGISLQVALYNSAFSYVVSLPVILLLAFVGALAASRKPSRSAGASADGPPPTQ